jgi:hypothetical protein
VTFCRTYNKRHHVFGPFFMPPSSVPTLWYTASGGKIVSEKGVGMLLSVTASLK